MLGRTPQVVSRELYLFLEGGPPSTLYSIYELFPLDLIEARLGKGLVVTMFLKPSKPQ